MVECRWCELGVSTRGGARKGGGIWGTPPRKFTCRLLVISVMHDNTDDP